MNSEYDIFHLTPEQLTELLRSHGYDDGVEIIERQMEESPLLRDDGTIDLFDYAAWLVGSPSDNQSDKHRPAEQFDMASVSSSELSMWLTAYNHIGYEVQERSIANIRRRAGSFFDSAVSASGIDFMRFVAFSATHRPRQSTRKSDDEKYLAHKQDMARRNREASAQGRDIGEIPAVANEDRKDSCMDDFRLFCETYFPDTFSLRWSDDHLKCIRKIEDAVLYGGLFALAMPRGSGKTSLAECAVIWASLYGHHNFVCLVGASETAALEILDSIKTEIETNEILAEDFPEVCYPIAALEGISNRCSGQTCMGERTRITWTSNELVLPTIENSDASGVIIRVAGITGRIRGMKYKRPDGRAVRPSLVIVDDPQTAESAGSLEQTRKRVRVLAGDILGLAGPGKKISGVMPCTVIQPDDMADQILDRDKHPDWNGEKCKLLYKFPNNMEKWDEYAEIRADSLREYGNIDKATAFYLANRETMDEGAVVEWDARKNDDEVSALQSAMNLYYRDPVAFASEYQNEPLKENLTEDNILSADEIARKCNGTARGIIPVSCTKLTMFVDIQKALLFYCVIAWNDDFTGAVVDYGEYPDQRMRRFTLATAGPTLQTVHDHKSIESQIYLGLSALLGDMMKKVFIREDGLEMTIDKAAIDANWGTSTDIVYQFCRHPDYNGKVIPAHGHYIGASSKPMSEYGRKPGEKTGLNWRIPTASSARTIRHVVFDSNFWKSFLHARLALDIGTSGNLTLFGTSPVTHELFSEHLTAEYRVRTAGRGRIVDEWRLRPDRKDNHWLDCAAGCCMLASMLGSSLHEHQGITARRTMRLSAIKDSHGVGIPNSVTIPNDHAKKDKTVIRLSEMAKNKKY